MYELVFKHINFQNSNHSSFLHICTAYNTKATNIAAALVDFVADAVVINHPLSAKYDACRFVDNLTRICPRNSLLGQDIIIMHFETDNLIDVSGHLCMHIYT